MCCRNLFPFQGLQLKWLVSWPELRPQTLKPPGGFWLDRTAKERGLHPQPSHQFCYLKGQLCLQFLFTKSPRKDVSQLPSAVYFGLKPTFKFNQIPPAAVTSRDSCVAEGLLCASHLGNEHSLGLHWGPEKSTHRSHWRGQRVLHFLKRF